MNRSMLLAALILTPIVSSAGTPPAAADSTTPPATADATTPTGVAAPRDWTWWLDNEYYKVDLNVRPRAEFANLEGLEFSQAWTVRSRLGIGNKPLYGFTGYAELEGTFSFAPDAFGTS